MLKFLGRGSMKGEKATAKTSILADVTPQGIARLVLRFFQFIMGIVVIGLYAQDLAKAAKAGKYADAKWVYAVFCGSISSIIAIVWMLPKIRSWFFFYIDAVVWFLWLVLFGIFGKMYINEDPEGNSGIIRMKRAAWIDMVNMLLWFITAAWGGWEFWRYRKQGTTHTGRAPQHV